MNNVYIFVCYCFRWWDREERILIENRCSACVFIFAGERSLSRDCRDRKYYRPCVYIYIIEREAQKRAQQRKEALIYAHYKNGQYFRISGCIYTYMYCVCILYIYIHAMMYASTVRESGNNDTYSRRRRHYHRVLSEGSRGIHTRLAHSHARFCLCEFTHILCIYIYQRTRVDVIYYAAFGRLSLSLWGWETWALLHTSSAAACYVGR